MSDVMVKMMAEVLSVLALATKQIDRGRFSKWSTSIRYSLVERGTEKFTKKLLGESNIEPVLQRLDRLTQEEARVTATHTLEVFHARLRAKGPDKQIVIAQMLTYQYVSCGLTVY